MGIRFIRQPSETPNISNADDARMIRYAYGNINGYIKGKGSEIDYIVDGTVFRINSGIIVLQGYEVEIDANGWSFDFSSISPRNYLVYLEVNLANQTATINSKYDYPAQPTLDLGDDLTSNLTGVARMALYTFQTNGNSIIEPVIKNVNAIEYYPDLIDDKINNLRELLQSSVPVIVVGYSRHSMYAQYAQTQPQTDNSTNIATTAYVRTAVSEAVNATESNLNFSTSISNAIGKAFKLSKLVWVQFSGYIAVGADYLPAGSVIATIPSGFRPKSTQQGRIIIIRSYTDHANITIATNGQITINSVESSGFFCGGMCFMTD